MSSNLIARSSFYDRHSFYGNHTWHSFYCGGYWCVFAKGRTQKYPPAVKPAPPIPPRYKSRFVEPVAVKDKQITGRAYVIDGDTIVIKKTKIRLAGIDAPELDEPWGQVAKSAMIRICQGGAIRAVFDG